MSIIVGVACQVSNQSPIFGPRPGRLQYTEGIMDDSMNSGVPRLALPSHYIVITFFFGPTGPSFHLSFSLCPIGGVMFLIEACCLVGGCVSETFPFS
jgi:hypothetical protein